MSPVLSVRVPPLMLLLHLWLIPCLSYFFVLLLLLLCPLLARFYRSLSSSESLVVSDYTVKPPVTQFYSRRGARLSDAPTSSNALSSDMPSSFIEDVPSSPPVEPSSLTNSSLEQLVRHSHHLRWSPDCYSPSAFTTTALSELASYREAILNSEWRHAMAEEIATLERTGTWDLVPCPPRVRPITCK
jgi:hypothetical protein